VDSPWSEIAAAGATESVAPAMAAIIRHTPSCEDARDVLVCTRTRPTFATHPLRCTALRYFWAGLNNGRGVARYASTAVMDESN
jgi:hypothetical protein